MAVAIPTLGYPSRTAAVTDMLAKGRSGVEIAMLIGITEKQVWDLVNSSDQHREARIRKAAAVLAGCDDVLGHLCYEIGCKNQGSLHAALERIADRWPLA